MQKRPIMSRPIISLVLVQCPPSVDAVCAVSPIVRGCSMCCQPYTYGAATVSRLLKIIGLFCRI